MAFINVYFYIENMGLTDAQAKQVTGALQGWGTRNEDRNPRNRNHWRVRLDGRAAIFEAWVDDGQLAVSWFQGKLAQLFGVANESIGSTVKTSAWGPYVDFTYLGVPKLRMGVFGGVNAEYGESRAAALGYMAENAAAWETA